MMVGLRNGRGMGERMWLGFVCSMGELVHGFGWENGMGWMELGGDS